MRSRKLPPSLPWVLKGLQKSSEHHKTCDTFPAVVPYLQILRSQGLERVEQDRDSCSKLLWASSSSLTLPRSHFTSWCGNANPHSLRWTALQIAHLNTDFHNLFGSTGPRPTTVRVDPFPTSGLKDLTFIFATTTKIRSALAAASPELTPKASPQY